MSDIEPTKEYVFIKLEYMHREEIFLGSTHVYNA